MGEEFYVSEVGISELKETGLLWSKEKADTADTSKIKVYKVIPYRVEKETSNDGLSSKS